MKPEPYSALYYSWTKVVDGSQQFSIQMSKRPPSLYFTANDVQNGWLAVLPAYSGNPNSPLKIEHSEAWRTEDEAIIWLESPEGEIWSKDGITLVLSAFNRLNHIAE